MSRRNTVHPRTVELTIGLSCSSFSLHSFRIDRRKYHPAPKVHGCVVRFKLTPPAERLDVPNEAGFAALVSARWFGVKASRQPSQGCVGHPCVHG